MFVDALQRSSRDIMGKRMNAYQQQHMRDMVQQKIQIVKTVDDAMDDLAKRYTTTKGRRFAGAMEERLEGLRVQLEGKITGGIKNQWALANKMNGKKLDGYLGAVKVSDAVQKSLRTPNLPALNAFIDRTTAGWNLSDRVWNFKDGVDTEMQRLVRRSVLVGKSAKELSKELKGFIRGKPIPYKGGLIAAKNLNYQAIRVAATEMNMAFRSADYLQNSRLPFVTGVTVHLSNAHPRYDICDEMAGQYPKGFYFIGWHPFCICYVTYDTLEKEEFVRYIKTGNMNVNKLRTRIPNAAEAYITKNGQKFLNYKNPPYWLRDNFTDKLLLREEIIIPIAPQPAPMVLIPPTTTKVSAKELDVFEANSRTEVAASVRNIKAGRPVTPVFVNEAKPTSIIEGVNRAEAYKSLGMKVRVIPIEKAPAKRALKKMSEKELLKKKLLEKKITK